MKSKISLYFQLALLLGFMSLNFSFKNPEVIQNNRNGWINTSAPAVYGLVRCAPADDPHADGALCTYSNMNNCTSPSECTKLNGSAPYMTVLASCLGVPIVTHEVWIGLTPEQLGSACVGNALDPYLLR